MSNQRISLRMFVVLVLVLGAGVGFYIRSRLLRVVARRTEVVYAGPTRILGAWTVDGYGSESLVYILVVPSIEMEFSGSGGNFTYATNRWAQPGKIGVSARPDGVYLAGQQVDSVSSAPLMMVMTGSVRRSPVVKEVELPNGSAIPKSIKDFREISGSALWNEVLQPMAAEEMKKSRKLAQGEPLQQFLDKEF